MGPVRGRVVELAGRLGHTGALEFLVEEVLDGLPDAVRADLAVAVAVGGGDQALLSAAAGRAIDADRLVAEVPLVDRRPDGGVAPHALWSTLGAVLSEPGERAARQRRAVTALLAIGELGRAADLALASGDGDAIAEVVRDACRRSLAAPHPQVLRNLERVLPAGLRERPEGLLLHALIARVDEPFSTATCRALEAAADACRRAGLVDEELTALGGLAWVLRAQDDLDAVFAIATRMNELAGTGSPEAVEGVRIIRAALAALADDDRTVLEELAGSTGALGPEWAALVEWLRVDALLMLGRPGDALPHALACRELSEPSGYFAGPLAEAIARSAAGEASAALDLLPAPVATGRGPFERLVLASAVAAVAAFHGRVEVAGRALELAGDGVSTTRPEVQGWVVLARALIAVDRGDDAEAERVVRSFLEIFPATGPVGRRVLRRAIGLAAVLVPDGAAEVDAAGLSGTVAEGLELGRRLSALRRGDRRRQGLPVPGVVAGSLPLRWAAELAVRSWAIGEPGAHDLVEHLAAELGPPVRAAIRSLAETDRDARRFLAAVPAPPPSPVEVRLLGPTRVHRDGVDVDVPELHRLRVRQLLALLVLRSPVRREEAADAIWSDLDLRAADGNLRVTLSHLLKVLEPDRTRGAAPFLVRSNGDLLVLAGEPYLVTDRSRFDDALGHADRLTAAGSHREALTWFERALDLWRGPPLADVGDTTWCWDECERLRLRFAQASTRAATLRAGLGDLDAADHHAARAIDVDPWSEDAHRVRLTVALDRGDTAAVRHAEQRCRAALDELGAEPSPTMAMVLRRAAAQT